MKNEITTNNTNENTIQKGIFIRKRDLKNPSGYFSQFEIYPSNKIYKIELVINKESGHSVSIIRDEENNIIAVSNNDISGFAPSQSIIDIIFDSEYSQVLFESLFRKVSVSPDKFDHGSLPLFNLITLSKNLCLY